MCDCRTSRAVTEGLHTKSCWHRRKQQMSGDISRSTDISMSADMFAHNIPTTDPKNHKAPRIKHIYIAYASAASPAPANVGVLRAYVSIRQHAQTGQKNYEHPVKSCFFIKSSWNFGSNVVIMLDTCTARQMLKYFSTSKASTFVPALLAPTQWTRAKNSL